MKESLSGKSRLAGILRGRGVYIALAASILAFGGVALTMLGQGGISDDPESGSSTPSVSEPVEQIVTGQPDDRTTSGTTTTTTTTAPATTSTQATQELYVLPLSNTVQKSFSADTPLYSPTLQEWRIHLGTDFAGEMGQPVKAITGGTVTAVEEDMLWGWCVTIDHGVGVMSRYCGVKPVVKKGDTVEVAQAIGTLEAIPCESAQSPHLHLEMTIDEQPVDPVAALALEVRYADTMTTPEK